ncbi:alpha/beta fold hydrolase [Xylophilus sp. ASV27]|uniref:alpha/beta fold hydrolase n=1 Tax=Xylophilus sp. ASV27 TaxID=2795129 RepID=UPI0018EC83F7|nr:alpha/beta fold hydrolase [Xylophilus sp. ASV27]
MTPLKPLPGTPRPKLAWTGAHGNRLCGDSWGDPSAPPVVLLHGGGQTRHSWRRTALSLAQAGYHAVAYDARGHGDSDWVPSGDYGDAAMAQDLACVLRGIAGAGAAARPVLIGASMGGITGLVATGEAVVQAAALILADVLHTTAPAGFERVRGFMTRHAQGFASLQEAADAIGAYQGARAHRRRSPAGLAKNLRQGADGRLYWHWDPRFLDGREDLAARARRLAQCARRLAVPTLLVRGAHSDVVTDEAVREFLALCPRASHVDVPGAGHMLTGDDNDAFGQMAIGFIRQRT